MNQETTLSKAAPTAPATSPPAPRLADYLTLLRRYVGPQSGRATVFLVLLLLDIGLDLYGPQLQRAFIDGALDGAPNATLLRLAGIFLTVAIVVQIVFVIENVLATDIAMGATNALRADLLERVLDLDLDFHEARTPGELIERIDGDVSTLGTFLSRFVFELVGSSLMVIGVLVLLYRIDVRIGAALTLFALIALVFGRLLLGISARRWAEWREELARLMGFLEERLSGTEDIRANGAVAHAMLEFFERSRAAWRRRLIAAAVGTASYGVSIVLLAAGVSLALAVGVALYREGTITIGTVFLLLSYSIMIERPIQGIARQLQDLQRAGAGVARVRELLAMRRTILDPEPGEARMLPTGALGIDLEDVTFAYGAEGAYGPNVLQDLSLTVAPGRMLGLVGRSGSGKSTLSKLLLRLHDVPRKTGLKVDPGAGSPSGTVRLSGIDVRDVPRESLRARTSMVTQAVQLFEGSLRDNLTLFDADVPDDQVVTALEDVGLDEWLDGLSDGLDTRLLSGGSGLSAGQGQLVALARILLADPSLVVLDEASSRLDPETERQLGMAITRLAKDRTLVIVAHRLSTVRAADDIAVLEAGRLVEHGARDALEADPSSRWSSLLRTGHEEIEAAAAESFDARDRYREDDDGRLNPPVDGRGEESPT